MWLRAALGPACHASFLVLASQSVTSEESPDTDKELKPSSSRPVLSRSSAGTPSEFLMIFLTLSPDLPGSSLVGRGGSAPLLPSAAGAVCPYCCQPLGQCDPTAGEVGARLAQRKWVIIPD